jgi:protein transport protein SEC13
MRRARSRHRRPESCEGLVLPELGDLVRPCLDAHVRCSSLRVFLTDTGPVWRVTWGHPNFGHILASCSYDGKVLIWREQAAGGSTKVKEHMLHIASVNSVLWAPHELGAAR